MGGDWNRDCFFLPLPGKKKECRLFPFIDGSTDRPAILLAIKVWLRSFLRAGGWIIHGSCVQFLIAQEKEGGTMELIASRLGDHIHRGAFTATVDGGKPLGTDYEFLDGIEWKLHYRT